MELTANEQEKLNRIISKFMDVKEWASSTVDDRRFVQLTEPEIFWLCNKARQLFLSQPNLLDLAAPIKIIGDIHGQYGDLIRFFEFGGFPPKANYLFLGDYVDRGERGIECTCLLLAFKLKYPLNFFMLRGNHECASINRIYGFYEECQQRYSVGLWHEFNACFDCLPVAAIVGDRIFCVHGGLSPELTRLDEIDEISRPTDVPDSGMLCDFMWSDPERGVAGWGESERGVSYIFGEDVVHEFVANHGFDLVVRAHQVVEHGYEFFAQRRLVTVFSAPNYCGEFDNAAAMLSVDKGLKCSFQVLQPST